MTAKSTLTSFVRLSALSAVSVRCSSIRLWTLSPTAITRKKKPNVDVKPIPFSSKVSIEKADFENISTAVKKFLAQERKECKLQKALDSANKMITELKRTVAGLTAELTEYSSVKGRISYAKLQRENEELRGKVGRYEEMLRENVLSASGRKSKDRTVEQE